jgi:TRAP transporter TAXI family solute receptor
MTQPCLPALALAAALFAAGGVQAQQLRLMTGPQGGSWYPLGGAIANIADKAGLKVQVLPGAGIANVKAIEAGKADLGFAAIRSPPSTAWPAARPSPRRPRTSATWPRLYPQYFQVVANADAGIKSLADLKGKSWRCSPRATRPSSSASSRSRSTA